MTTFARVLICSIVAVCVGAIAAPLALATWAAPTTIAPGRISMAGVYSAKTGKTVVTRAYVKGLATGTAQLKCSDPKGDTCPIGTVTTKQAGANAVIASFMKHFGAKHPLGPGAVVQITSFLDTEEVSLTRVVTLRVRAKAKPLVSYGCYLAVPSASKRSCSSSVKRAVSRATAGEFRVAAQAWADANPAAVFGMGATASKLGNLTGVRAADGGPTGYALATYAVTGQKGRLAVHLQRQYSDTGDAPTAWKVVWVTRSLAANAYCRIDEQPRELWFPALADPAVCAK